LLDESVNFTSLKAR